MYFRDVMQVIGKHATIMRDGVYYYLPSEIGLKDRDPNTPIACYRPYTEVYKAYEKFNEYGKLPITVRHPDTFLNLNDSASFSNGFAEKPELKTKDPYTVIDCIFNIQNGAKSDYDSGTRELSCGWEGEFERATEGPYEFIQRFKDINHIAIVPQGRAGDICKINDGGRKMKISDKLLELLKAKKVELTDDDKKVIDAIQLEIDNEIADAKKKAKDEKDPDDDDDKDGDDDDKETKDKKTKDKKKNKDDAEKLIADAIATNSKKIVDDFSSVLPILSELKTGDITGKSPAEIKALFIKQATNTDIAVNDAGLDAVFKLAVKNYENPAWKGNNGKKVEDTKIVDLARDISSISFLNSSEVK